MPFTPEVASNLIGLKMFLSFHFPSNLLLAAVIYSGTIPILVGLYLTKRRIPFKSGLILIGLMLFYIGVSDLLDFLSWFKQNTKADIVNSHVFQDVAYFIFRYTFYTLAFSSMGVIMVYGFSQSKKRR